MKTKKIISTRIILLTLLVLMPIAQATFAQDALTSIKYNLQNFKLSSDSTTILYDVYLQNVNSDGTAVAVAGYTFRLGVPTSELGTNAKTVTVTNASTELGASTIAMAVSGSYWIMKFLSGNAVLSYSSALLLSTTFPGTRIGTFNITNTDGTKFSDPQSFTATFSGSTPALKSTVTIFVPNTTTTASNSSTAQPESNFTGLGTYSLTNLTSDINSPVSKNEEEGNIPYPNPANNSFYINIGDKKEILSIFDINGSKVLTKLVTGFTCVDISALSKGVYIVNVSGFNRKLIKK